MAIFNPEPPKVDDPVYFHWSRPAAEPPPNRSSAEAIKGVGEGIASSFKVADELVQQNLRTNIYKKTETLTDQYTTDLKDEKDSLTKPASSGQWSNLKQAADTLVSARSNNKMSETEYRMKVDTLAKDYRGRFPGYTPEIDQIFQEATGSRSTANQLIQSLVGDINTIKTQKDTYHDKILTKLTSELPNLGPIGPTLIQQLHDNKISPLEAMQKAQPILAAKSDLELTRLQLSVGNEKLETQHKLARDAFGTYAVSETKSAVDHIMLHLTDGGDMALSQFYQKIRSGAYQPKAQDMAAAVTALNGYTEQLRTHLVSEALEKKTDAQGRPTKSWMELAGPDIVNEEIDKAIKGIMTPIQESFSSNNTGLALAQARANTAIETNTQSVLLNSNETGFTARVLAAASKLSPQLGEKFIEGQLGLSGPVKLDDKALGVLRARVMTDIVPGPPDPNNPSGPRAPDSLKSIITTVNDTNNPTIRKTFPDAAKTTKGVLDTINTLHDSSVPDEVKINISNKAFGPANLGMVSLFDSSPRSDVYMPGRTQPVRSAKPSSYQVFDMFVNQGTAHEEFRLGQQQPQVWNNYKNWAEHTFTSELYATAIQDLGSSTFQNVPGVRLTWDTDSTSFKAVGSTLYLNEETQRTPVLNPQLAADRLNQRLEPLNHAIKNMTYIAKENGWDPNEYITGLITSVSHGGVVPKMMQDAIVNSRPDLVSKYTDDQLGDIGDLQSFVKNPGRGLPGMRNNAPAASSVAPRGHLNGNLSEQQPVVGTPINIPPGVDPHDYIEQLKKEGKL